MPIPGLGHKSFAQVGLETVFKTAVPATDRFEIISANVNPVIGFIRDPSLNDQPSRRAQYQAGRMYRGSIVTRMNYAGLLKLIDGVMGTDTFGTAGGDTTPGTPNVHIFTEGQELNSHTIELGEGDIPTGKVQRLEGAVFTGVTVRGTAGQGDDAMLQAEWGILAASKTSNQDPTGALDPPDVLPALYHQATVVDDGVEADTAQGRVRSFEFSIQNNVTEDRFYLGALDMDQPIRGDFLTAGFRFTEEFNEIDQFNAAIAFTEGSPELSFTDGTNVLILRMAEAHMSEYSNPVQNYGVILATLAWEGFRTTGNADSSAAYVEVHNSDTAI